MIKYRFRVFGGTLLAIKDLDDCATFERGRNGEFECVSIEGDWMADEIEEAWKNAKGGGYAQEAMKR